MILSVSRRTDIPQYYSEWFLGRIRAGFLCVRNSMNPRQVSRIVLSPQVVDCIVFWTKNPKPMMGRLEGLKDYDYYFQFTLTGYGRDVEPGLPSKEDVLIPAFRELAEQIGRDRVIWRYDPILFNETYTPEWHVSTFRKMSMALAGCTRRCVISFVDSYARNRKGMRAIGARGVEELTGQAEESGKNVQMGAGGSIGVFASQLKAAAREQGMELVTCAEQMDLTEWGIPHGRCIDPELIERITGFRIEAPKDPGQRRECGCIQSIDVGRYDTCPAGCVYCYAGGGSLAARKNFAAHRGDSPLLCSELTEADVVRERPMRSQKEYQLSLFP